MSRRVLLAAVLGLLAWIGPSGAQTSDPSFRVVNNTANVVNEVYASPSNERSWGQDRLGTEVIRPGGLHIVRLPADGNCNYDVRIVYQGGSAEERRNLNTCQLVDLVLGGGVAPPPRTAGPQGNGQARPQPGSQQQGNPSFNLVNQSGRVIEEFYASPPRSRTGARTGWATRSCSPAPPSRCGCRRASAATTSGWSGRAASRRSGAT
ncbi:hypothetical protein ACFQY5_26170 [Paeniroseomonas aquatica]|uniref:hypothetical protein n=1 Tax=Paeniroseomonas aquatica TaxID=373043 RepID=UPI00361ECDAD